MTRPGTRRTQLVGVKLSHDEHAALKQIAAEHGRRPGDMMRFWLHEACKGTPYNNSVGLAIEKAATETATAILRDPTFHNELQAIVRKHFGKPR